MKRTLALFFALTLIITALIGCTPTLPEGPGDDGKTTVKNRVFYDYFDTVCVVYDYTGGTEEEFSDICAAVEAELSLCHKLFDIYNEYEGIINLKTINKNAGGAALSVDGRIIDLLTFSKEMHTLTGGHMNVAMGAVLSIWHDYREAGVAVPDAALLAAAGEHTSIDDLIIDTEAGTVRLADVEMSLDVGAVAKGYTAERIAGLIEGRGIKAYALDFGGNLRVGEKTSGDGWVSGIRNPNILADEEYVRRVTVKNAALVTSGTYERFYTVSGVRYHHIINKDSLMPENRYTSVSVHTKSSAYADALSTALFNMSMEDAEAVIRAVGNTEVTFVLPSGEVVVTNG